MSTLELPPGYRVFPMNGRWYADKMERGVANTLQTVKRENKWFRSDTKAAEYCRKHAVAGLEASQEVMRDNATSTP